METARRAWISAGALACGLLACTGAPSGDSSAALPPGQGGSAEPGTATSDIPDVTQERSRASRVPTPARSSEEPRTAGPGRYGDDVDPDSIPFSGPRHLRLMPEEGGWGGEAGDGLPYTPMAVESSMYDAPFNRIIPGLYKARLVADVVLDYDPSVVVPAGSMSVKTPATVIHIQEILYDPTDGQLGHVPLWILGQCQPNGLCNHTGVWEYVSAGRVLLVARPGCYAQQQVVGAFLLTHTYPIEDGRIYGPAGDSMPWPEARQIILDRIAEIPPEQIQPACPPPKPPPPPPDYGPETWP